MTDQLADMQRRRVRQQAQDELVAIIDEGRGVRGDAFAGMHYAAYSVWGDKTTEFLRVVWGEVERQRFEGKDSVDARISALETLRDRKDKWVLQVTEGELMTAIEVRRHYDEATRIVLAGTPLYPSDEASLPKFSMDPRVDLKMVESNGGRAYDSQVVIVVRNARDSGGTRDTAEGVTPDLEIFDMSGQLVTHYVGWDNCAKRDFRPTREQHTLYVAFRGHADKWVYATLPTPSDRYMLGWGSEFRVRVTLRGDNWIGAIAQDFLLTRVERGGLRLERAGLGRCPRGTVEVATVDDSSGSSDVPSIG